MSPGQKSQNHVQHNKSLSVGYSESGKQSAHRLFSSCFRALHKIVLDEALNFFCLQNPVVPRFLHKYFHFQIRFFSLSYLSKTIFFLISYFSDYYGRLAHFFVVALGTRPKCYIELPSIAINYVSYITCHELTQSKIYLIISKSHQSIIKYQCNLFSSVSLV